MRLRVFKVPGTVSTKQRGAKGLACFKLCDCILGWKQWSVKKKKSRRGSADAGSNCSLCTCEASRAPPLPHTPPTHTEEPLQGWTAENWFQSQHTSCYAKQVLLFFVCKLKPQKVLETREFFSPYGQHKFIQHFTLIPKHTPLSPQSLILLRLLLGGGKALQCFIMNPLQEQRHTKASRMMQSQSWGSRTGASLGLSGQPAKPTWQDPVQRGALSQKIQDGWQLRNNSRPP